MASFKPGDQGHLAEHDRIKTELAAQDTRNPESEASVLLSATFATSSPVGRFDVPIVGLLRNTLNNACKFILGVYWPTAFPGAAPITDFGGTSEHFIRHPAAAAFSVAGLIQSGKYDESITGVTQAAATVATVRIVSSLAALHKANGGTWGGSAQTNPMSYDSQAGLWAFYAAAAGKLVWASMTSTQQNQVKAMIFWEADRVADWPTWSTWFDAAGTEVQVGDSKGEETAWMATPIVTALSIDPAHANARAWKESLARMALYQNSIPADLADTLPVNGLNPSLVLTGTNVRADGTLVNHGIVHPDYIVSAASSLYAALPLATLAGVTLPGTVGRHADLLYRALTTVLFTPGVKPYVTPAGSPWPVASAALAPGGTIYPWPHREGFYYPQGNDWGANPRRTADKATFDVMAYRYGWDRGLTPGAGEWAIKHLAEQLAMQARFTTGQTYATGDWSEDNYGSPDNPYAREAWVGCHLAGALLTMTQPPITQTWDDLTTGAAPVAWATKIPATSPALWWRLGEASGTVIADSSGNNRGTTLENFGTAATRNAASLVPSDTGNTSITFNGGSRARLTNPATFLTGARTFAIAFKRSGNPAATERFMVQASSTGNNRLVEASFLTSGKLDVTVRRSDGTPGVFQSAASVCDNAAHLLVVVIHGGGAVVYLDGKAIGQVSRDNPNYAATDPISIGALSDAGSPTSATLDEFAVWPRLMHADEVADLYRCFTGV